jgi:hypothetical protein
MFAEAAFGRVDWIIVEGAVICLEKGSAARVHGLKRICLASDNLVQSVAMRTGEGCGNACAPNGRSS